MCDVTAGQSRLNHGVTRDVMHIYRPHAAARGLGRSVGLPGMAEEYKDVFGKAGKERKEYINMDFVE